MNNDHSKGPFAIEKQIANMLAEPGYALWKTKEQEIKFAFQTNYSQSRVKSVYTLIILICILVWS